MSGTTRRGLLLAALILLGWLGSWAWVQVLPLDGAPLLTVLAVLVRTVLQTGLFIVGHDAMHGVLVPGYPRRNDGIGRLALLLYAGLPYGRCRVKHHRHHRAPATASDPDFHAPGRRAPLAWYLRFLGSYLGARSLALLLGLWGLLALASSRPLAVLLVGVLPLLLSSLQLFVVGTYLPHRHQERSSDRHRAISLPLPPWLSLLACFHFGYHREHHAFPQLAWHQLASARRQRLAPTGSPR